MQKKRWLSGALLAVALVFGVVANTSSYEGDAAQLFKQHSATIYQIRLIDLAAEKKSVLGSGFLVAESGVLATNYHVVEPAISKPGKYRIEYLATNGDRGELELLDIDVINDLALLRSAELAEQPFQLAESEPTQGDTIYSLGNPHDIGFTVVPGTYNGISEGSYYRRIHFSGSINSGMSGGPALDGAGRVVGINVATAGNQISFLVPVEALHRLLDQWQQSSTVDTDFSARIHQQLKANQQKLFSSVLSQSWNTQKLGEATVLSEMSPFVKCWGRSTDEKRRFIQISNSCQGSEHVYLNSGFTTGTFSYEFFWLEAGELDPTQFRSYYQSLFANFIPDNNASKWDAGNYVCEELFIKNGEAALEKAVLCTRAYRRYPGLYDVLFIGGSIQGPNGESDKAFIRHFTLAGVNKSNIDTFLKRFMATAVWPK